LQPAEHVWPLYNEPLVNRHFHDLDELEDVQAERLCVLTGFPRPDPVSYLPSTSGLTLVKNSRHHREMDRAD
jgi:hypothetical protein